MGSKLYEELCQFRRQLDVPAVFGGIADAGGGSHFDAVGVTFRGGDRAAQSTDRVHIGSCCKMLTAALFGTFVERGGADWGTPVADLLPDLAATVDAGWQRIPVHALLHCLGGMVANPPRRYLQTGFTDQRGLPEQREEMAALALSQTPRSPGRFVYSNMSYIVIGAAIDRLVGTSYEDALSARLLQPLGIDSAGYGPPKEVCGHAPRVQFGAMALGKGKPADPTDPKSDNPPMLSSAGTLHLRIGDWIALLRLFLNEEKPGPVSAATIERILQLPQNKAGRMAMGWAPAQLSGAAYGAQGSNVRWSATVLMDASRRRVACVVCNDGRSRVLMRSPSLVHRLLML